MKPDPLQEGSKTPWKCFLMAPDQTYICVGIGDRDNPPSDIIVRTAQNPHRRVVSGDIDRDEGMKFKETYTLVGFGPVNEEPKEFLFYAQSGERPPWELHRETCKHCGGKGSISSKAADGG
jgi:hypothetical protein